MLNPAIQIALRRSQGKPIVEPVARKEAYAFIADTFDAGEACEGCEWNWGHECRLLMASGPRDLRFCAPYDEKMSEAEDRDNLTSFPRTVA
tara:strand:- start:240 stop:512 length:273 start_codon:yes stop_codon:yes gene_type:complete